MNTTSAAFLAGMPMVFHFMPEVKVERGSDVEDNDAVDSARREGAGDGDEAMVGVSTSQGVGEDKGDGTGEALGGGEVNVPSLVSGVVDVSLLDDNVGTDDVHDVIHADEGDVRGNEELSHEEAVLCKFLTFIRFIYQF